MLTGKESLLEALSEALSMEKGTREFYDYASQKAIYDKTRETFEKLRDWEDSHMHYLLYLYQALSDERDMITYEEYLEKLPAHEIESGISIKTARELFEKRDFIDDTEAIRLALEIEGKAFNLYREFSEDATDSNAQVVFQHMKEQEAQHINELKNLKMMVG
ncbi:MAG: ferritin family protein [Nitrospirae bacterium]|nr:ferritin family protein [Nitrospirota bacterium]